ncbi:MAG TPA: M28 family peptidase [Gemmatimonadaceae bacterium]|nr:M28 family peptidase [Gemmatimonadaceae bacterium]
MADAELVERAKLLLDRLSEKPRFAGSVEEARARDLCKGELQAAGFECRELPFEYSQSPAKWGPALAAALQAATIIIVARMAIYGGPLAALAVGGGLVIALFFVEAYAKRWSILDFPAQRARSLNLEARRGAPRVWLVAHLDSKAQAVSMLVRIAGSVAMAVAMALTGILLLLAMIGIEIGQGSWHALQLAAILAAIPGLASLVVNVSPGAVDNATGVVAAILAARSAEAPKDLGVLITSGEELGLAGARVWAAGASTEFQILNCDTVDDEGDWRCMYSNTNPSVITGRAKGVAYRLGLRLRVTRLIPGILADNMAFADRGIGAITLSRGTLSTLARIHTRRDTSNALTGKGAADASALLSALAKELA